MSAGTPFLLDHAFRCRAIGGTERVNDAESSAVGWLAHDALPAVSELTIGFLSQASAESVATHFLFSGVSAAIGDLL